MICKFGRSTKPSGHKLSKSPCTSGVIISGSEMLVSLKAQKVIRKLNTSLLRPGPAFYTLFITIVTGVQFLDIEVYVYRIQNQKHKQVIANNLVFPASRWRYTSQDDQAQQFAGNCTHTCFSHVKYIGLMNYII